MRAHQSLYHSHCERRHPAELDDPPLPQFCLLGLQTTIPYRPEAEGALTLHRHEFGLDVIALIGQLQYTEHRSVPKIRTHLAGRPLSISERPVTNLLYRYDELLAVSLADDHCLKKILANQGGAILAIDGLQPDVGHEVLRVMRNCLSGEILLAKCLLSARQKDLADLLSSVKAVCTVSISGVESDGQHSIRKAFKI